MNTPIDIHFHDIGHSDALEAFIRGKADKLVARDAGITSCRVVVSRPKARGHQGHLFKVRIDIALPGVGDVIVDRDPGQDHAHEDVHVAIRDAFAAAKRRLQEQEDRRSGAVKHHETDEHHVP